MKILIIEDEINAINRLKSILTKVDADIEFLGECKSVKETINWFENNKMPDIIFSDIQLTDGICFEIFNIINIKCPIIFVTAFNNYTLDAFKTYGIDYILKPYSTKDISKAINKFENLKSINHNSEILKNLYNSLQINYKTRFFAKINHTIYTIPTTEIQYFKFEDAAIILVNNNNKVFVINYSLDTLEQFLDPKDFFRINRKFIIHINSIKKMNILSKSRITVTINNDINEVVSRSKSTEFRNWLEC